MRLLAPEPGDGLGVADAAGMVASLHSLLPTSKDGDTAAAVELLTVRRVEAVFNDISVVDRDLCCSVWAEFPGRDGIGQGPQAEPLPFGTLLKFMPGPAFGSGAGLAMNPGKPGQEQFFVEAYPPFHIDQSYCLTETVGSAAPAVKGNRFYLHHFVSDQRRSESPGLLAEILPHVRRLDAIEPNPLLLAVMQDGEGVAVGDGDGCILPGRDLAAAPEADKKERRNSVAADTGKVYRSHLQSRDSP